MFLRFAELPESEEAVVEFASRFGPLFQPYLQVIPPWSPEKVRRVPASPLDDSQWLDDTLSETAVVSGTYPNWTYHSRKLHTIVKLQEAINSGDPGRIDAFVSWRKAGHDLAGHWAPAVVEGASQDSLLERAEALRDRALTTAFKIQTLDDPAVSLHMFDGELLVLPTHLLGAMWLQLAASIEEGKRFRKCPARDCPLVWFEVSTGPLGVREDAEFCSARCRHTAYRDRKTSARQMHRDGVSVTEIATRLKTDVRRVRAWLAKK